VGDSVFNSQILRRWHKVLEPALPSNRSDEILRYILAILAAVAALLLRKALDPLLGSRTPFLIAWLAVVFSAWYCGFWQSLFTVLIETLGAWFWILPPYGWRVPDRSDRYGLIGFTLLGSSSVLPER